MEGPTDRSSALRKEAVSITRSESAILPATTSPASSIAATTLSTASQSSAALTAAPVEVNTPEQAKRKKRAIQMAAIEKTRPHRDRSNRTRPAQDRKRAEIREQRALNFKIGLDRIREQLGEKCSEAMMKRRFEEMKELPSGIMDTSDVLRSKWEDGVQEAFARWEADKVDVLPRDLDRIREQLGETAATCTAHVDAARNGYPDGLRPNMSKDERMSKDSRVSEDERNAIRQGERKRKRECEVGPLDGSSDNLGGEAIAPAARSAPPRQHAHAPPHIHAQGDDRKQYRADDRKQYNVSLQLRWAERLVFKMADPDSGDGVVLDHIKPPGLGNVVLESHLGGGASNLVEGDYLKTINGDTVFNAKQAKKGMAALAAVHRRWRSDAEYRRTMPKYPKMELVFAPLVQTESAVE
jgi:hypothetical protein